MTNAEARNKLGQAYKAMNGSPKMAALPYEKQLEVRKGVTYNVLSRSEEFSSLDPVVQRRTIDNIALKARPVFSDPQNAQRMDGIMSAVEQGTMTAEGAKALTSQAMAVRNSVIAQAAIPVLKMAEKINDGVVNAFGGDLPDEMYGSGLMRAYTGEDGDKLFAYMNTKLAEAGEEEVLRASQRGAMRGQVGGLMTDTLPLIMGQMLGSGAMAAAGKAFATSAKTAKLGRFGTYLGRAVIPTLIEGTSSGAYGVVREQALATLTDNDEMRQDNYKKILKTFGEWALLDYAIGFAASTVLPFFGGVGNRMFGAAKRKGGAAAMKQAAEQVDTHIEMAVKGELAPEVLRQFDPEYQHYILGQRDAVIAAGKVDDGLRLNPYDDLLYNSTKAEMVTYRDPETGSFFIHKYDPELRKGVEIQVDDIIAAKREVSEGLYRKLQGLEGKQREAFVANHKNMLQYSLTRRSLDGALDPMKVKGEVGPKEYDLLKRKKGSVSDDFISPLDRPYIGANEAEKLEAAFSGKGFAKRVKVDIPEEQIARLREGEELFQYKSPVDLKESAKGNDVFVMVKRPAEEGAVREARALAEKAIARGAAEDGEALLNMYLMEAGYDGILLKGGTVRTFYPDKMRVIATKFDPTTGKIGNITTVPKEEPSLQSFVRRSYRAIVGGDAFARNDKLVSAAAMRLKGDLKAKEVKDFADAILRSKGVNTKGLKVKLSAFADAVDESGEYFTSSLMSKSKGEITLTVPKRISSASAQKKFLKELMEDELMNIVETMGGSTKRAINAPRITKRMSEVYVSPFKGVKAQEAWLKSSVEDIAKGAFNKTAKGYSVKLPGRTAIVADTIEELTDRVMVETLDTGYLKMEMAKNGYRLNVKGNNITVRAQGLDQPVTGNSVNEVLDKLNYRPEKISKAYAPKVSILDNNRIQVDFAEGVMIGNRRSIRKALSKFEDMDLRGKSKYIRSTNEGTINLTPSGDYEVRIPEMGLIENFSSAQSATKFLRSVMKDFDQLSEVAKRKGLMLSREGSAFKLISESDTFTIKSRDDLVKALAEYPDTTGGKSLFTDLLNPEELNTLDEVLYSFQKSKLLPAESAPVKPLGDISVLGDEPVHPIGSKGELRSLIANTDRWAEAVLPKAGHSDLLHTYRQLEVARRLVEDEVTKVEDAIKAIFTDPDTGKLVDLKTRRALYYHMGAQTADEQVEAIAQYGELTSKQKIMREKLRDLLGREQDGMLTGLAGKFNLDPETFLGQYMPRIKDWAAKNREMVANLVTADDLIEAAAKDKFGGKAPKNLKAFFKNMRTSEALEFVTIDDPLKALQHYTRVGMRQKYMGRIWEDMYSILGKENMDPGIIWRMNKYRDAIMGMAGSDGKKVARRIGEAFGKEVGLKNGDQMVDGFFSLNYLANMGYRPWLALRNSFQVWTTLAPRIGNMWVGDAVRKVSSLSLEEYQYLEKLGVVSRHPPLVNTIMDADSLIGKVTHKALGMFKSSDDYTRAIAYHSAAQRFDFAMEKWSKGGVRNLDEFMSEAGITKMDNETITTVRRLLEKGDFDSINAARARFGTQLSEETMFGYRKSQAPTLHTGSFWGELFGQYGTYSAGYRANIARGISNGKVGDKAAFAARFLINNAALYTVFKSMKIKADNFKPWSPAMFGGGPNFELAVSILSSMQTGYKGRQARSMVGRKLSPVIRRDQALRLHYPEVLPGSLQLRYGEKALEYFDQGDFWRGFLSLTTTPVTDPELD